MEDVGSLVQSSSAAWRDVKLRRAKVFVKLEMKGKNDERVDICSKFSFGRFFGEKFWFKIHVFMNVYERCFLDEIAVKK